MSVPVDQRSRTPTRIDGYAPIRDYAVIGNKRTAALVALDGSIDWLCLPAFASPSVFGALLDDREGGRMRLSPSVPFEASRRYQPGTNVLETTFTTEDGSVRVTDAMSRPIAHSLLWNQVIRRVDGLAGRVPMDWSVEPRFGYGADAGQPATRAGIPLVVHGHDVLAVETFGAGEPSQSARGVRGAFTASEGEVAVVALSAFHDEPLSFSSRERILARLEATAERWRRWLAECTYDGPWAEAVRRSALALDLLVDDETGAIAAAVTMGLPERIGGPRNYDYRYTWLRDANLTLEAMQRLGFEDQVHTSLGWMLDAIARTAPWLRPMYRLDGTPALPDRELGLAGYRDSRPVVLGNGAQDQLQLGSYGDLFDMTLHFVQAGNALTPAQSAELTTAADYLCRIWDHPDASLWELGNRERYTQSTLACWLALDRAVRLAGRGELPASRAPRWRAEADRIAGHIEQRCWSEAAGGYARSAGSDELDAGVLLASRGSFLDDQPERFNATVDAIRTGLGAGGPLLYRYSGMQEQEGAFLACSFWAVDALASLGRRDEAAEMMDALVGLASDVGLYSEEIEPGSGEFLGNLPQALSHLALVNAAHTLATAS